MFKKVEAAVGLSRFVVKRAIPCHDLAGQFLPATNREMQRVVIDSWLPERSFHLATGATRIQKPEKPLITAWVVFGRPVGIRQHTDQGCSFDIKHNVF